MGAIAVSIFVSVVAVVGFLYFHFEEKKLIKENQDLESRVELTEMQLKENEQKNKLLKNQIEEKKNVTQNEH